MNRLLSFAMIVLAGCLLSGCHPETQNPVSSDALVKREPITLYRTMPAPTNVQVVVSGFSITVTWVAMPGSDSSHVLVKLNGNDYVSDTLTATQLMLTNLPFGSYSVTVAGIVTGSSQGFESTPVLFTLSDVAAPTVTVSASPILLCPRNGKWVIVNFTGVVANTEGGASYELKDEYRKIHYTGSVPAGPYSVKLKLKDRRKGFDKDGRQYTFTITATNSAGSDTASVVVSVPREKKPRNWNDDDDDDDNDNWGNH